MLIPRDRKILAATAQRYPDPLYRDRDFVTVILVARDEEASTKTKAFVSSFTDYHNV